MVILINPFTVFAGREKEFLALWDQTGAIFRRSSGYISANLCKAFEDQPMKAAPYTHINIAEWQSAALYREALMHAEIRRLAPAYAEVCTWTPPETS